MTMHMSNAKWLDPISFCAKTIEIYATVIVFGWTLGQKLPIQKRLNYMQFANNFEQVIFQCILLPFFSKLTFSKYYFMNTIRVSNNWSRLAYFGSKLFEKVISRQKNDNIQLQRLFYPLGKHVNLSCIGAKQHAFKVNVGSSLYDPIKSWKHAIRRCEVSSLEVQIMFIAVYVWHLTL